MSDSLVDIVLHVQGMHCHKCADKVQAELARVPGVEDVLVSLKTGRAAVACREPAPSRETLVAAVERAGFRVKATA